MPQNEKQPGGALAAVVSAHGWGHAARTTTVLKSIRERLPGVVFELFTRVPEHFFRQTVDGPLHYHATDTDVGVVQNGPLHTDPEATVRELDAMYPPNAATLDALARTFSDSHCRAVLCDISPLGIEAARSAGLPSILLENFTWDWIYRGLEPTSPALLGHADYLERVFASADYLVQTEPLCEPRTADLLTGPVGRPPTRSREASRRKLGLAPGEKAILLTMGGIPASFDFMDRLAARRNMRFMLPGVVSPPPALPPNVKVLGHTDDHYHPDVVHACDAVVAKLGYSTLAEIFQSGVPFGYVTRPGFREAGVIEEFVRAREMPHVHFTHAEFLAGNWIDRLDELLALPRGPVRQLDGARRIAEFVCGIIS